MFSTTKLFTLAAAALYASSSLVGVHATQATWYQPNGELGACGAPSQNSDLVVALPASKYDGGDNCWRHIGIHYEGKYVDATVVDMCPGCDDNHIDISEGTFEKLADLGDGIIKITWEYAS
ncbi:hypothetical protein D9758_011839 [Tetrapyrgos nigripes]|uniref:RlpA-like protein double-psi beta-barrel domain-containing protein n=1 Tax=Tetrapyrgos nigripes TaxID=182062 RepID=A0A8H5FN86_9AGAR|nr:hypothetical protein D9758_011839 [Tetrapyrgos nigripes]